MEMCFKLEFMTNIWEQFVILNINKKKKIYYYINIFISYLHILIFVCFVFAVAFYNFAMDHHRSRA